MATVSALLFDADGQDRPVQLGREALTLQPHQLLWVDVQAGEGEPLAAACGSLPADDLTRDWLCREGQEPALHRLAQAVHLRVLSPRPEKARGLGPPVPVNMAAQENVVYTVHAGPAGFLDAFRAQLEADTHLGALDAAAFLAVVLGHHVEAHRRALEPVEAHIDHLDERILAQPAEGRAHLARLIAVRREVSALRRVFSAHRPVYVALASPEFTVFQHDQPEERLSRLLHNFEHTQDAIAQAREAVLGTFDLLMSSTGQRTNEVMRVLTVVTVTLGIIAAVAGLMGMNFQADVFKAGNTGFRDVLLFSLGLIVVVVGLGRWRGWL
ncbi:CorA family divalent cation transporter [Deinococcus multiflagellatus]|uniref:CorA family divalent cation transporter n=1 Tax=Deinococcus multiflagellatus TaxID=1656887 RepID=A0ABW1ZM42_9DEIO|nr:CorA family divalent cation transporter [Deinococcus multiflagellatus]MBZ9716092.1 CorA family divalent cation transporter [Deinococcus multiflagellatus]